jgi:hypothetical protein
MGCGGSYPRDSLDYLHLPLNRKLGVIGILSIDEEFMKVKDLLEQIEDIRELVIDNRDAIIIKSGACAYNNVDINAIVKSFVLVLSVHMKGKLGEVRRSLVDHYPFINIDCGYHKKAESLYKCFIKYLMDLKLAEVKLLNLGYLPFYKSISLSLQDYIANVSEEFKTEPEKL